MCPDRQDGRKRYDLMIDHGVVNGSARRQHHLEWMLGITNRHHRNRPAATHTRVAAHWQDNSKWPFTRLKDAAEPDSRHTSQPEVKRPRSTSSPASYRLQTMRCRRSMRTHLGNPGLAAFRFPAHETKMTHKQANVCVSSDD